MGLTDIHTHILPGIDDGAKDPAASRTLLEASREQGVTELVFTPHFYPERVSPETFLSRRAAAVEEITPLCRELGMEVRVGAEVQFSAMLASMPLEQLAFSGSRYLLLELLPLYIPYDTEGLIGRLRDAGYIPILAHVERFGYIEKDPTLLYRWIRAGALGQINAGWILKDPGALKRAKQYYDWGLIHCMASDTHSIESRKPNLSQGLAKLPGDMARAFRENSARIFRDEPVEAKTPVLPKKFLGHWR